MASRKGLKKNGKKKELLTKKIEQSLKENLMKSIMSPPKRAKIAGALGDF